MNELYLFVVDTDQYAGNFEREMCAYMTGAVGECGVGEEWAELYKQQVLNDPFDGFILQLDEDDYHCPRPVRIVSTDEKNWVPNSIGIYMEDKPTDEDITLLRQRAFRFTMLYQKHKYGRAVKILGFRLIKRVTKEEIKDLGL